MKTSSIHSKPPYQTSALYRKVRATLVRLLQQHGHSKLLVAVSGGVDSMVLLHFLAAYSREKGIGLTCGHVFHGTNSVENAKARDLVQQTCQALKVEYVDRELKCSSGSSEEEMRTQRRQALISMSTQTSSSAVVLAHHLNDQVETFFMRLLTGSSINGLRGMRACTDHFWIRPMLEISKRELLCEAENTGIVFVHDVTNRDTKFERNWLRHQLMPMLETRINPKLATTIANLTHELDQAHEVIENQGLLLLDQVELSPHVYDRILLSKAPIAIQTQVLMEAYKKITHQHAAIGRDHVKVLLGLVQSADRKRSFLLPLQVLCESDHRQIRFVKKFPLDSI
ncbi:MAG: tRNA lysidine(34) synthetase TilS [Bdellovibrionota bacterium]